MIRRPPRSTHCISSAASDVYKRQVLKRGAELGEVSQTRLQHAVRSYYICRKPNTTCDVQNFPGGLSVGTEILYADFSVRPFPFLLLSRPRNTLVTSGGSRSRVSEFTSAAAGSAPESSPRRRRRCTQRWPRTGARGEAWRPSGPRWMLVTPRARPIENLLTQL